MTKTERQNEGIYKYLKAGAKGTLDYVMRFGKTKTAITIISRLQSKYTNAVILIAVPSLSIKEMWLNELPNTITNVTVTTAQELLNITDTLNVDLFIVDEIHKFITPNRLTLLDGSRITYTYNLGLTGTYPYDNNVLNTHFPVVDTITEEEAISNKWISNFREYNVALDLTESDKKDYIKYSNTIYEVQKDFKNVYGIIKSDNGSPIFGNSLEAVIACYSGVNVSGYGHIKAQHIRELFAINMGWQPNLDLTNEYNLDRENHWNPEAIKKKAVSFYRAMRARNEIHNINSVKLDALLKIYAKYNNRVCITFNGSTIFADMITDAINKTFKCDKAISYHSNCESKPLINFITNDYFRKSDGEIKNVGKTNQLKYITEMLKIGKYNIVNSINALDEGFSVDNIDLVITTSGDTNPTKYSQRNARGKTIDAYNPNKITLIFNLFFNDFTYQIGGEMKYFKSRDKTKLALRQGVDTIYSITLEELLNL